MGLSKPATSANMKNYSITDKHKTMTTTKQLEYLNNAAQSIPMQGIEVVEKHQQDKRKTKPVYVLTINGTSCISPTLDYDKMNHYILGMIKAFKITNNQ